ncbi:hypothetical protein Tco_1302581 [Tanacetum coccineum]
MIESEKPLKKKDQISFDEQEAIRLQAEFDEEERISREKDEANVSLTKEWDDIHAMVDANYQLAQRLQAKEQETDLVEGSSKRAGDELEQEVTKKQKIVFKPHVEDRVWRNQQDYRVLDWKLYDSCGVHSLRMQHMHIHMLVEKRYPLTPATITDMLNKKLQCDHFSEMAYQLLKLLTKQLKNQ